VTTVSVGTFISYIMYSNLFLQRMSTNFIDVLPDYPHCLGTLHPVCVIMSQLKGTPSCELSQDVSNIGLLYFRKVTTYGTVGKLHT